MIDRTLHKEQEKGHHINARGGIQGDWRCKSTLIKPLRGQRVWLAPPENSGKRSTESKNPKTTLEKGNVTFPRTWSCSFSSLFWYVWEVSLTSWASKHWDQSSNLLRGNGKALLSLKKNCKNKCQSGNKLSKPLRMLCFNFLIVTFTINDMFPVHFSNQQKESMNHILVPFRDYSRI